VNGLLPQATRTAARLVRWRGILEKGRGSCFVAPCTCTCPVHVQVQANVGEKSLQEVAQNDHRDTNEISVPYQGSIPL